MSAVPQYTTYVFLFGRISLDPLSRALLATHLRGSVIATFELAAPWTLDCGTGIGVPVHYIISGQAWLHDASGDAPARLVAGDIVMFPRWDRHMISAQPEPGTAVTVREVVERNGRELWSSGQWNDEPLLLTLPGEGPTTSIFSMVVELESGTASALMLGLPAVVHANGDDSTMAMWLRPVLQFMETEADRRQPGYAIVQSRLAELLFMQLVRSQLLLRPEQNEPQVRLLLDRVISASVDAIRADPGRHWTVANMARDAGLSRSAFAARFATTVGVTPFQFLRDLRLDIAAQRLRAGALVKEVFEEAHYATYFSFSQAFTRRFRQLPGRYRASFVVLGGVKRE